MKIADVGRALPPYRYTQAEIGAALERVWSSRPGVVGRLDSLLENVWVKTRHLALPIERYHDEQALSQLADLLRQ